MDAAGMEQATRSRDEMKFKVGDNVLFTHRTNPLYPLRITEIRTISGRTEYKLTDGKWWFETHIKHA